MSATYIQSKTRTQNQGANDDDDTLPVSVTSKQISRIVCFWCVYFDRLINRHVAHSLKTNPIFMPTN